MYYLLIHFFQKSKKDLNEKGYEGAVLMDLFKVFDALNYDLLIAKLSVYGFKHDALKRIYS